MEPLLQFFQFENLEGVERQITETYYWTAQKILDLPRNPERTVALRELLNSKEAALRALKYVTEESVSWIK